MQAWRSREAERSLKIVSLQTAKRQKQPRHNHLGALLLERRKDAGSSQQDVADAFERYCSKEALAAMGISWPQHLAERFAKIKPLAAKEYGKIELNRRAPWFNWLPGL